MSPVWLAELTETVSAGPVAIVTAVFGGLAALYSLYLSRQNATKVDKSSETVTDVRERLQEAEHRMDLMRAERDSLRALNLAQQVQISELHRRIADLEGRIYSGRSGPL